ncbi:MAG: hypothetical protein OXU51_04070 [Candidatus Poribacteria bacterium]|nr:hypothetical protein [Candidatus Poribacteria bacterium]
MPAKRYPVILDQSQRDYLLDLIASGTESVRKLTRGRILLKRLSFTIHPSMGVG